MHRLSLVLLLIFWTSAAAGALQEDEFPVRVRVQPLFLVPQGQPEPTKEQISKLHKHMRVSQKRFKQMLSGRDTFEIAGRPKIVHSDLTLETFKNDVTKMKLNTHLLNQFFSEFGLNRFNCPYVFFVIFMNPNGNWPGGSGRPINPGFNGGGGIAIFTSKRIDDINTSVQGSIQHELGHAFGLTHVTGYGYDQYNNRSIMSYEKVQVWKNFIPPRNPSILIPEDIRALAMNKRVFPNLYYDPKKDVPEGYKLCRSIPRIGFNSDLPGRKPYKIKLSTTSGEEGGTKAGNVVHTFVKGNRKARTGNGLVASNMWMSGKKDSGWIDLVLEFPIAVRMNSIRVQSQCGGGNHPIMAIRVEANTSDFVEVARREEPLGDEEDISFKETKAKQWRLHFLPDDSGQVVIRGLGFYSSQGEFFCQKYPTHLMIKKEQE